MSRRPFRSSRVETLGWLEWFALLPPTARLGGEHLVGLARYLAGASGELASSTVWERRPPSTAWVSAAEESASVLSDGFLRHSKRAWFFASALSIAERTELDQELLYVVSLLHDTGLFAPIDAQCFTATGARLARETAALAGVGVARADLAAHAISDHISIRPTGELAQYLQRGSLLDATGSGIWTLDRRVVPEACRLWPRARFPAELRQLWLRECRRVPYGRSQYARCPGLLIAATRAAPMPRVCSGDSNARP